MVVQKKGIVFLLSVCVALAWGNIAAADLSGREIMDEVSSRHDRETEFVNQKMILRSMSEVEEVRDMQVDLLEKKMEDLNT